jgi:hypothetical protein
VLIVIAFVLSAALCATAAVAFVIASRDEDDTKALPRVLPTVSPTAEPTATPSASPTASPTPAPSATPAATPSATAGPSASPRTSPAPRVTPPAPRPSASRTPPAQGLFVDATLDPAEGNTTTKTVFRLFAHATDGDGTISLESIRWDANGPAVKEGTSKACASTGKGDCRDFAFSHTYATTGWHEIFLTIVSGPATGPQHETTTLHLRAYVESVG